MSDGVIAEKRFDTPSLSDDKSLLENPIYHETEETYYIQLGSV